jgi:hypothetical protein
MKGLPVTVCLAVTCHDPTGAFEPGVRTAGEALRRTFAAVVVNATSETSPATMAALEETVEPLSVRRHAAGSVGIGTARRDAIALALGADCSAVAYSDLDHVLRWATVDTGELARVMALPRGVDLVVIGRSPRAFACEPHRLRVTEGAVNQAASLALGLRDEVWDFMIAARLMTHETAHLLVEHCPEESIANDVAWPLHAHREGRSLAFAAVEGLAYRYREDFGAAADDRDSDPLEWVRRLEIASQHATAMRRYLTS